MTRAPERIRRAAGGPDGQEGFLLIGVVLFVFVLTILGLSLFSLSGYEAQFHSGSNRRAESFYAAASGIERARFVLIANRNASEVRSNLPSGVVYAVAKQGADFATADSNSKVNFTSANPVWIRVRSDVRGVRRTLEQKFDPSLGDSIYERLFTLAGPEGLEVRRNDAPTSYADRWDQTELNGLVRTTVPVTGGFDREEYWYSEVGPVDWPDIDGYFATHCWATAAAAPAPDLDGDLVLNGGPRGQPVYYKSAGSAQAGWSLNNTGSDPLIRVYGTVVWMFESGVRFENFSQVRGSSDPLLVMIARYRTPVGEEPRTGIAFQGGLDEPSDHRCPVVLISDGRVNIQHDDPGSINDDSQLRYLSVFARNARVMGPEDDDEDQELRHRPDASQDQPGGVVYELVRRGLLPNTAGGTFNRLDPYAGTWREIPN